MSTWIEYQIEAFVVSAKAAGLAEDLYLVATEAGSNNTAMMGAGGRWVRARDWRLERIGGYADVMAQTVRAAAYCSGGMFKPRGRSMHPEGYIRSVRARLHAARDDALSHLVLCTTVAADDPLVSQAESAGLTVYREPVAGGGESAKLIPPEQSEAGWGHFVRTIRPLLIRPEVCSFGRVFGLTSSA